MVRSRALIAGLLAAALLFAAACGSDEGPSAGGTIIDAEDQSPPILNVLLADGATVTAQRIVSNVLQNLLTADQTGAYVPQLAERVPDGRRHPPGAAAGDLPPASRAPAGRTVRRSRAPTSSSRGAR